MPATVPSDNAPPAPIPESEFRDRAERVHGRSFDLREAVVVGDTPDDIHCARVNGARALAVATGRHSVEELREHGADAVFEDLSDTSRVVRVLADE